LPFGSTSFRDGHSAQHGEAPPLRQFRPPFSNAIREHGRQAQPAGALCGHDGQHIAGTAPDIWFASVNDNGASMPARKDLAL
jgi:hypothetical protein